jgi:glucokinase
MIGAIDIGGTKIGIGLATLDGQLVAKERFPTFPERGPLIVIGQMIERLRLFAVEHGAELTAVGVGTVGPLDFETGEIHEPPNFPGWRHVPIRAKLEQAFRVPVVVDNDANAAAMAEYRYGAGRGSTIMVYTTISTGVGGGIVVNGQLLHGLGGGAGEFGHATIKSDGPLCGCGNTGCLEAMGSGTAIVRRALEGLSDGRAGHIVGLAGGDPADVHAGHVIDAAEAGDPFAKEIWDDAVDAIAIGLGNVVSTLAPDRLVVGGGVANAGDRLLVPLKAAMARRVRLVPIDRLDLRVAEHLHEAGLMGAVALANEGLNAVRARA